MSMSRTALTLCPKEEWLCNSCARTPLMLRRSLFPGSLLQVLLFYNAWSAGFCVQGSESC